LILDPNPTGLINNMNYITNYQEASEQVMVVLLVDRWCYRSRDRFYRG